MRILVVGATGTIGSAVVKTLKETHEVIGASRKGETRVDLSEPDSIRAMYHSVSAIDAVICTTGEANFGPLDSLSDKDFAFGLENKLMGQINLVRVGREYVKEHGSITLTSGILADEPHAASVLLTTVNAAVEGFVRAAALGLTGGKRLNVVSPPMVKETAEKMGWGNGGIPTDTIARLYVASLEGTMSGEVLRHKD